MPNVKNNQETSTQARIARAIACAERLKIKAEMDMAKLTAKPT